MYQVLKCWLRSRKCLWIGAQVENSSGFYSSYSDIESHFGMDAYELPGGMENQQFSGFLKSHADYSNSSLNSSVTHLNTKQFNGVWVYGRSVCYSSIPTKSCLHIKAKNYGDLIYSINDMQFILVFWIILVMFGNDMFKHCTQPLKNNSPSIAAVLCLPMSLWRVP